MTSHVARAAVYADLYTECVGIWRRVQARFGHIKLPTSADWEDIRAEAITRVFSRYSTFDPTRGSRGAWIMTLMCRVTMNALRGYLRQRDRKEPRWQDQRVALLWPDPLRIRVEQVSIHGEEAVVVEPDVVDGGTLGDPLVTTDFRATLGRADQWVLDSLLQGLSIQQIAKRARKPYGHVYEAVKRLRGLYRAYLMAAT